jgi:hypothetical protein
MENSLRALIDVRTVVEINQQARIGHVHSPAERIFGYTFVASIAIPHHARNAFQRKDHANVSMLQLAQ